MKMIDFHRSHLVRSSVVYKRLEDTEGVHNNACRTRLLSRCTVFERGSDKGDEFFVDQACIGEHMYLGREIAQKPTAEVCLIVSGNTTKLLKKFASHDRDVVQTKTRGERDKQFDGTYYDYSELQCELTMADARPLTSPKAIIDATLDGETLVGRTEIIHSDSGNRAVLEYPVDYMNVHVPTQRFGVDVGPMLFPRLDRDVTRPIDRIELAFIMYQDLEHAEFAVRVPTSVGASATARTLHYSEVIYMQARNELFALSEPAR